MASSTEKLTKSVVDGLSDTRTYYGMSMNRILEEADRNDNLQAYLWGFIVTYLYNRAGRWQLGVYHTPNQEYIAERCYEMVMTALEDEYSVMNQEIPISGSAMNPPEIKLI